MKERKNSIRSRRYEVGSSRLAPKSNPEVLRVFMDYLAKGAVRDETTKKVILLTGLSAYSRDPINLFLKGPSSIGKSFNVSNALKFFGGDVWWLGGLSPTALVHEYGVLIDPETGEEVPDDWMDARLERLLEENKLDKSKLSADEKRAVSKLKRKVSREYREILRRSRYLVELGQKILVFLEAPHPRTYQMLRPILSHDQKEITFKFTDKTSKGALRTRTVVLSGWPATIFCTSEIKHMEDLATRGFTLTPEMSSEKYGEANVLFMRKKMYPWQPDTDLPALAKYVGEVKTFLSLQGITVLTPFGEELARAYPHTLARDMRDLPHFSALIDMMAAFHAFQRPLLKIDGEPEAILATREDLMRAYGILRRIIETTRTGLPKNILKVFMDVMVPLSREQPDGFLYEDLVKKHNEVFPEDYKSSKTLYSYVGELRKVGYADTKPHPESKRYSLIYVLKNPPDVLSHLVGTLASSFLPERLKKWWNDLRQRYSPETDIQLTLFEEEIGPENLYEKCYRILVPEEQRGEGLKERKTGGVSEKGQANIPRERDGTSAESFPQPLPENGGVTLEIERIEEKNERPALGNLLPRLRDEFGEGTEDEFMDLAVKLGLSQDEARRLFDRLKGSRLFWRDKNGRTVWSWS